MTISPPPLQEDVLALRIGRAISGSRDQLAEAISFKAGCVVVASMIGEVLESNALVMTVTSATPSITLHIDWAKGAHPRIIDSRESGFEKSIPAICSAPPAWETDHADRIHVEIRSADPVPPTSGGLVVISTLLLPFFELARRTERITSAMSLFEVALTSVATRNSDSASREIVQRVGESIAAATAFYPVPNDIVSVNFEPTLIYTGILSLHVSEHLFTAFGRIPDGPLQRAFDSPPGAAPTTRISIVDRRDAQRIDSILARLGVVDYVALRVMHKEQPIGVLVSVLTASDATESPRLFTINNIATIASAAYVSGWAIPLAEQQARLRRSLQESEMLRHLAQVSFQHKNQTETLELASSVAQVIFGADYVAVASIDHDGEPTNFRHVSGNRTNAHDRPSRPPATERVKSRLKDRTSTVIQNLSKQFELEPGELAIHQEEGLVTSITVPFELPDGSWSILLIGFREVQAISEDDVRFAMALSKTIAAAL